MPKTSLNQATPRVNSAHVSHKVVIAQLQPELHDLLKGQVSGRNRGSALTQRVLEIDAIMTRRHGSLNGCERPVGHGI